MSDKQILVYVARHGTTELNEEQVFRGDSDPPLDKKGFRDANQLGFYFKEVEFSYIFCSDKVRSETTANIVCLSRTDGLRPIISEYLRPWNVGDFGGLPKTEENIKRLQAYIQSPDTVVPGGESLNEFRSRVRPCFFEAIDIADKTGIPVLLVVHSSVIHEVGDTFAGHHEAAHVRPGGVAAIFIENGSLNAAPIFKPDAKATTQNILGVGRDRSGLTS